MKDSDSSNRDKELHSNKSKLLATEIKTNDIALPRKKLDTDKREQEGTTAEFRTRKYRDKE